VLYFAPLNFVSLEELNLQNFAPHLPEENEEQEHSQDDRDNGEKLPWCGELDSVVELLPDGAVSKLSLIGRLERRSFLNV